MRVSIIGVSGMLGIALFFHLGDDPNLKVQGIMRKDSLGPSLEALLLRDETFLVGGVKDLYGERLIEILKEFNPDVIINCVGCRQSPLSIKDTIEMITINSLWPHTLASLAQKMGARVINISTDAVFSGARGKYTESCTPSPVGVYGRSKLLGEINYPNCLTLRTSLIGHVSEDSDQLVDWLIRQKGIVNGYKNAIFSGLPTIELASIIRRILLEHKTLEGVYHIASQPISKYELLKLIVKIYGIEVTVVPVSEPVYDRSLNAASFFNATGYKPPDWQELVERMYKFYRSLFVINAGDNHVRK